jgi:hypothetical protein
VPAISYRDSEYYFSIAEYVDKRRGIVPGSFAIARRPGEILSFEVLQPLTWDDVAAKFGEWLTYLKFEVEAPDLWTELAGHRQALAAPIPEDNSPFTPDEQRQIRAQLDRIEGAVLANLQLTADEGTAFRADMDYLKESAARSGRRDWTLQVVGILGSCVLASVMPAHKVSEIWTQYFVPLLHSVARLAQHLPRLGP